MPDPAEATPPLDEAACQELLDFLETLAGGAQRGASEDARRLSLLRPWTRRSAELTQFAHPTALCGRIRLTCACTFPVAAL
jgi:hypothetical protein